MKNVAINWKNIKNLIGYSEQGIVSKEIFKNGKVDATLFCMAEDTAISEHTSTKEGVVYVLEGKGIFTLEGEGIAMEPGVIISMKNNAVHSIKAQKNTSFILILVK
ncbi:MAG: cupin domain-containing protein [Candidatus Moranbacteria bacterium CG_4_9_14_3_um_filter_42_9]|nr:MAG: cupin domain-containing protein [Candidatus Moranbacteria bacterium CG_4_9_14_3_um_filter_42_9]